MQFHEYTPLRVHWARQDHDPRMRQLARDTKNDEFRKLILSGRLHNAIASARVTEWEHKQYVRQLSMASIEDTWVKLERPYYNCWPLAMSLAANTKLTVPFSEVALPYKSMLLRFPQGNEPFSLGVAMLYWNEDKRVFMVQGWFANSPDGILLREVYTDEELVEDWFQEIKNSEFQADWIQKERLERFDDTVVSHAVVRLAVFIGLLAHDIDMITPVVLAKDRQKYESTNDPAVKRWLEDRAARRAGRGFDVGRRLQEQKEKSPHWRNPHLALFWTGPGRTKPIIKIRSGAVVQRVSMAEVPTGYLGPETEDEDTFTEDTAQREPVSKAKRFEILKRDSYTCQICGRSAEADKVKLHVDHKIPRVKGGSNEDDNLWSLCEDCNLGKSDRHL